MGRKWRKEGEGLLASYAEWKSQLIMHIARKRQHRGQRTRCRHAGLLLLFNFFLVMLAWDCSTQCWLQTSCLFSPKHKKTTYQSLFNTATLSLRGIYNFRVCRKDQGQGRGLQGQTVRVSQYQRRGVERRAENWCGHKELDWWVEGLWLLVGN